LAHFIQRYPPALGGSEAYFARLGRHLAGCGDAVTVWTTSALDLEAFWQPSGRLLPEGTTTADGVTVRRYRPWRWPLRRYILKAVSLIPLRRWQGRPPPCNPVAVGMWRSAGPDG